MNHVRSGQIFRQLMAFDLGVVVDEKWNVLYPITAEDWGCMFSDPLREKLSLKGRTLYENFLEETRKTRRDGKHWWNHGNLCEISRKARKLLKEADSPDCITREG